MNELLKFVNENSGALTLFILALSGWTTNELRYLRKWVESLDRHVHGKGNQ